MTSLDGRTALVTGAAGGIGRALVTRLTRGGARVIAVDVAAERLDALAAEVPGVETVLADVASCAGADRAMSATDGGLDILCNNAGVSDGLASLDELSDDGWDRVIAVNLRAAFLMSRRSVPLMLAKRYGVILNTSSVAGLRGGRGGLAYTASKWALVGMTQNIAATLGPAGIRSHAICPGLTAGATALGDVPLTAGGAERITRDSKRPPEATPDDVAAVAMFLIGDEAAHLNGTAIPVDAGWIAY